MMKKILLTTVILLSLCGCSNETKPQSTATPAASPQNTASNDTKKKVIEAVQDAEKYQMMTKAEDSACDFDKDGAEDIVELLTDAKKDDSGEFMWDDSQDWALTVTCGKNVYPLYEEHIHGRPSISVSEYYQKDGSVVPAVRLSVSTGASFEIREYRYEDGRFIEEIVYETGAINELPVNRY